MRGAIFSHGRPPSVYPFPNDERRGSQIDGAGRLQRRDAVHASVGELAERQGKRAQDADAADAAVQPRRRFGQQARVCRLDVDHAQPLLRPDAAKRPPAHRRPLAALGDPLLTPGQVADEREADVVQRRPVGDGDREAEEGQAALGVERSVDRVDDHHPGAVAIPERPLAELLRDEPERDAALGQLLQPTDRRRLGLAVDDGGVVSPLALADNRLAVVSGGEAAKHVLHVRRHRAAEAEPVLPHGSSCGSSRNPDHSLGKKYVDFWGIRAPARATSMTCSSGGARRMKAAADSPESTSAQAAPRSRT